jgi:streptomycin 6-kinase
MYAGAQRLWNTEGTIRWRIQPAYSRKAIMIANGSLLLALTRRACAAVVHAVGRKSREGEKKQLKEDLRTWEGEGGNPAPSRASGAAASIPSNHVIEES